MEENNLMAVYQDLFRKTWHKMVSIVGIHTVMVLVQRSLWLTRQKFAEAALIGVTEDGVSLEALGELGTDQFKQVMEEFFISMIEILARLVGEEITQKIAEGMDVFGNQRR